MHALILLLFPASSHPQITYWSTFSLILFLPSWWWKLTCLPWITKSLGTDFIITISNNKDLTSSSNQYFNRALFRMSVSFSHNGLTTAIKIFPSNNFWFSCKRLGSKEIFIFLIGIMCHMPLKEIFSCGSLKVHSQAISSTIEIIHVVLHPPKPQKITSWTNPMIFGCWSQSQKLGQNC